MRYRIPGYAYAAFSLIWALLTAAIMRDLIPLWIGAGGAAVALAITEAYARTMLKMDREDRR